MSDYHHVAIHFKGISIIYKYQITDTSETIYKFYKSYLQNSFEISLKKTGKI